MRRNKKQPDELKEYIKSLNIKNGKWEGPDGRIYYVCHQGNFYVHTITVTRIPLAYDCDMDWFYKGSAWDWIREHKLDINSSTREVCYERIKDEEGRNVFSVPYNTKEEFDVLFNQFMLGYKEYQTLLKEEAIAKDFN